MFNVDFDKIEEDLGQLNIDLLKTNEGLLNKLEQTLKNED